MSELGILERPQVSDEDSAKRRQIIEGARAIFLSQGFDAASMNDIARAAGVSKGTLYVYFKHKEQLFEAIVEQECETQAEGIFELDADDHDVEAVLTRLGKAAASTVRLVVCDLSAAPYLDLAGCRMLHELHAELAARGAALRVVGAHGASRDLLRADGIQEKVGGLDRTATVESALRAAGVY